MKALIVDPARGAEPFLFGDWPDPRPEPGWAKVRVRAAALNRNDLLLVDDRETWDGPHVLGADFSGVIVEVGDGVDPSWTGTEVLSLPSLDWGPDEEAPSERFGLIGYPIQGGQAEYVVAPVTNLYPKPRTLSWEEAAALPLAGVTAWRAVVTKARAGEGTRLLVTGASGGVATFAVQIAAALGAEVHVTTSTEEKLEQALGLGAAGGVVRRGDWVSALEGPFDAIVDSAGADVPQLLGTLRRGGRLVMLGRTADGTAEFTVGDLFWRQLSILGTSMGSPKEFVELLEHVDSAGWKPVLDRTYPLADGAAAYARMAESHFGKVVLIP